MSIPTVLDVAIGLIVVYYALGAIVSLVTRWINEMLETRSVALERYLIKIVGDKKLGDLTSLPQLKSLRPIRYKNLLSVFISSTEPKRIEKVPVSVLVDSYFDLIGLTANKDLNADQLLELVNKLPPSEGRDAFINWIYQGVTNVNDLRARTTAYFTGLLDQAASTFKANARSFVIILSLGLTLLFGTDSIQLAKALWTNAELRAIAAAQAQVVVAQEGPNADLTDLIGTLSEFSIKFGWWQTEQFPQTNSVRDWSIYIVLKILGLAITVGAVAQGSSFWYDLLKKIVTPTKGGGASSSVSSSSSSSVSDSGDAKG